MTSADLLLNPESTIAKPEGGLQSAECALGDLDGVARANDLPPDEVEREGFSRTALSPTLFEGKSPRRQATHSVARPVELRSGLCTACTCESAEPPTLIVTRDRLRSGLKRWPNRRADFSPLNTPSAISTASQGRTTSHPNEFGPPKVEREGFSRTALSPTLFESKSPRRQATSIKWRDLSNSVRVSAPHARARAQSQRR